MNIETYTPEVIDNSMGTAYAKVLVELDRCASCKRPMMPGLKSIGPKYYRLTFKKQAENAGWPLRSGQTNAEGEVICVECAESGKAAFICAICGKERPSNEEEESIGDPPEYLCKTCYETVSAKVWDKKMEELRQAHRWDFE